MSKISANPFHKLTGDLLPVYLDIYLLGDLTTDSMAAVTRYLHGRPAELDHARVRWEELLRQGDVAAGAHPPFEQQRVVVSRPIAPRSRLSSIRLFAAAFGIIAALGSTYGFHLYQQQRQVEQAGPVFERTESEMEASSLQAGAQASVR